MESIEAGFKNKESKQKVLAVFASKNSKAINLFRKIRFSIISYKSLINISHAYVYIVRIPNLCYQVGTLSIVLCM